MQSLTTRTLEDYVEIFSLNKGMNATLLMIGCLKERAEEQQEMLVTKRHRILYLLSGRQN